MNTNKERTKRGLVKVYKQSCVEKYAERQARWMASHHSLDHQNLTKILHDCNLTAVSENIAVGYTSGPKVVAAWMASSGHRHNILRGKMRYIGIGAVQDERGRWWVSQVFGTRR